MRVLELIMAFVGVIALLLAFVPFPGASEIVIICCSILSIIYFYGSFALFNNIRLRNVLKKNAFKDVPWPKIILSSFAGVSLSILAIGIMFKINFLPGANNMLVIGLFPSAFIAAVALFLTVFKSLQLKTILYRILPFLIVASFLFAKDSDELLRYIYRHHPEYAEARINLLQDPENPELLEIVLEEERKIY